MPNHEDSPFPPLDPATCLPNTETPNVLIVGCILNSSHLVKCINYHKHESRNRESNARQLFIVLSPLWWHRTTIMRRGGPMCPPFYPIRAHTWVCPYSYGDSVFPWRRRCRTGHSGKPPIRKYWINISVRSFWKTPPARGWRKSCFVFLESYNCSAEPKKV